MRERVSYARSWQPGGGQPWLDADRAGLMHGAGQLYTAILGDPLEPRAAVEVAASAGVVTVLFLDERQRVFASYSFGRAADDRLLLEQVDLVELADGDDTGAAPTHVDRTSFDPEGAWLAERRTAGRVTRTAAGSTPADRLNTLVEVFPAFGDYASISRFDRAGQVAPDTQDRARQRVEIESDVRLWPPAGTALTVRALQLDGDAGGVRLTLVVDAATFPAVVDGGLFNLLPEAVRGDLRRDLDVGASAHLTLHLRPPVAAMLRASVAEIATGLLSEQSVAGVALSSTELWFAETVTQEVALPAGTEGSLRSGLATIWSPD